MLESFLLCICTNDSWSWVSMLLHVPHSFEYCLTLIYLMPWISFHLAWWTINIHEHTMPMICICLLLNKAYRHSFFHWYMTCLDSQLYKLSAIRFIFSTLKILKWGGWIRGYSSMSWQYFYLGSHYTYLNLFDLLIHFLQ